MAWTSWGRISIPEDGPCMMQMPLWSVTRSAQFYAMDTSSLLFCCEVDFILLWYTELFSHVLRFCHLIVPLDCKHKSFFFVIFFNIGEKTHAHNIFSNDACPCWQDELEGDIAEITRSDTHCKKPIIVCLLCQKKSENIFGYGMRYNISSVNPRGVKFLPWSPRIDSSQHIHHSSYQHVLVLPTTFQNKITRNSTSFFIQSFTFNRTLCKKKKNTFSTKCGCTE